MSNPDSPIARNLERVRARVDQAAARAGRSSSELTLIAVSKFKPAEAIREAHAAGQRDFGENYVQELLEKREQLADLQDLRWHLIGHLQTKKAKQVIGHASTVHAVDSERLASELARRCELAGLRLAIYLEVNLAGEASKAGCTPEQLTALIGQVRESRGLDLVGLMAIPPAHDDPEQTRPYFAEMRRLAALHGIERLSMGMSQDFECAIEEGATDVRVGTAIFGARS
jgi:pyridoxal phosphate enzyme (YggS family)